MLGHMDTTQGATAPPGTDTAVAEDTPNEATATADGRMWRKVVAFEWEQRDYLMDAAERLEGDDRGNVSAVIRAAVDEYAATHPAPQEA